MVMALSYLLVTTGQLSNTILRWEPAKSKQWDPNPRVLMFERSLAIGQRIILGLGIDKAEAEDLSW